MEARRELSVDVGESSLGKTKAPPLHFVATYRIERAAGSDTVLKHFVRD